jgi:translocation and assembly module TamB
MWRWIRWPAALFAALLLAAVLILPSGWFADRLRARIIEEAERATGGRVELKSFAFVFPQLRIEVGGFVLHGLEGPQDPPLVTVDAGSIDLRVLSFVKRSVDVEALRITRPRVHIQASEDGRTNFPTPQVRHPNPDVIDPLLKLAAKRLWVEDGYLQINDRRVPLDLEASALRIDLHYLARSLERREPAYEGKLQAAKVRVKVVELLPPDVGLDAAVWLQRGVVRVSEAHLRAGQSDVMVSGLAYNLLQPSAELGVSAKLNLREWGPALHLPLEHTGTALFAGRVKLDLQRRFRYEVEGRLQGRGLAGRFGPARLTDLSLASNVKLTPEVLNLRRVEIGGLGGRFQGQGDLAGYRDLQLQGDLSGLDTSNLSLFTGRTLPFSAMMSGPVHLTMRLGEAKTRFDGTIELTPGRGPAPTQGFLNVRYDEAARQVAFQESFLETPRTQVQLQGVLGRRLTVRAKASDLADVQAFVADPLPFQLRGGTITFDGAIAGDAEDPRVTGKVTGTNVWYDRRLFQRVNAEVDVTSARFTAHTLALTQDELRLEGQGGLELDDFRFLKDTGGFVGTLTVRAPVERLRRELSWDQPISGMAQATGQVRGTLKDWRAEAQVRVEKVKAWDQEFEWVRGQVRATPQLLEVSNGAVQWAGAEIPFSGRFAHAPDVWKTGELELRMQADGLNLASMTRGAPEWKDWGGIAQMQMHGRGEWRDEQFRLMALDGQLWLRQLSYQRSVLGQAQVTAASQGGQLMLTLAGDARGTRLSGQGRFPLTADAPGEGAVKLSGFAFENFLDLWSTRPTVLAFQSALALEAQVKMPLRRPQEFQAEVTIPRVQLNAAPAARLRAGAREQDLIVTNARPIRATVTRTGAQLEEAFLSATGTNLGATGRIGFGGADGWNLQLKGGLNLAQLQLLNRDLLASGNALVDATVKGSLGDPQVEGRLELKGASLYFGDLATGLDNANGVVNFDRQRATIQTLRAEAGGGQLSLAGFVGFGGPALIYRLQATADRVRVRYPEGASTTVNAALNLTGTSQESLLAGTLTIVRAGFNPRTDFSSLLGEVTRGAPLTAAPQQGYLGGMQFDVRVESAPNLEFTTSLTRGLQAEVDLHLRGSVSRPTLLGNVSFSEGEIALFGNRYTVNRGEVRFFNPTKIEPTFDLEVETRARGITVNVSFSGTLNKLNTAYRSDPPLQPSEIIALLAIGRDPNVSAGIASSQATRASALQGVGTLVGEAVAQSLSGRLQKFFGVTRIKIDPQLTGVENTPQARLTVEQQVSKDITLTFITNLSRTQEQIVRVQWDLNKEWSAIAVREENGLFGIDFQYRKRFR